MDGRQKVILESCLSHNGSKRGGSDIPVIESGEGENGKAVERVFGEMSTLSTFSTKTTSPVRVSIVDVVEMCLSVHGRRCCGSCRFKEEIG